MELDNEDLTGDLGLSRLQVPHVLMLTTPALHKGVNVLPPWHVNTSRDVTNAGRTWRQAKKVRGVQTAFQLFNRIMRVPGKGELTMVELRVRPPACAAPQLTAHFR